MQFYFIRHAQSENNSLAGQTVNGHDDKEGLRTYMQKRYADTELSSIGKQQIKKLGEFIASRTKGNQGLENGARYNFDDFSFTHLYVSPMIRTLDTAVPVAEALDLNPVIWEDLHEQGGIWKQEEMDGERFGLPGMSPASLKERYPRFRIPSTMKESGWWDRPYEEWEQCYYRSGRVLDQLQQKHAHTEDKVAVVSHSLFFSGLMLQMFRLSIAKIEYLFFTNNVSITRIDFDNKIKKMIYQNRVEFLPSHLVT